MNELQKFNFDGNEVRVQKDEQGEPLFCLSDVCKVLGITNTRNCKKRLVAKGVRTVDTLTAGGRQKVTFISEQNLYKVVFQSRKEEAERFTDWVTGEVLPAIRKTGSYGLRKSFEDSIQNLRKKNGAMNEVSEMVCLLYNINESLRLLQETPMVIREERMIETRFPKRHLQMRLSAKSYAVTLRHDNGECRRFSSMRNALRFLDMNPTGMTRRFAEHMVVNGWRFQFN